MWILSVTVLLPAVVAFPVFTFNESSSSKPAPSFADLAKDVDLPNSFILCSSVKHARFDDVGFFYIAGKDSRDWLRVRFLTSSKAVKLALNWDGRYQILGELENPKLDYWYHVCMRCVLMKGELEVAVNGKLIGEARERNITNIPTKLRIRVGADYYNRQFQGSVANVQVLVGGSITDLSSEPCRKTEEAILQWTPDYWKVVGSDWSLMDEFQDIFCDISDSYNLAIASGITFEENVDFCKNRLKNSMIPFEENHEMFLKYVAWHNFTTQGVCYKIWAPFSDADSEGLFRNVNNNNTAPHNFWDEDEPNGGKEENFVKILVPKAVLYDAPGNSLGCGSYHISSSLLLQLDGRCKESLIGDIKVIIKFNYS